MSCSARIGIKDKVFSTSEMDQPKLSCSNTNLDVSKDQDHRRLEAARISFEQRECTELGHVLKFIEKDEFPTNHGLQKLVLSYADCCVMKDGVLTRDRKSRFPKKIVVCSAFNVVMPSI
uniref:Uncharacterized protein n=1 Tax=Ditylenchus dipsaci TaxID=166011 RepID=A0A915D0L3_9BILA